MNDIIIPLVLISFYVFFGYLMLDFLKIKEIKPSFKMGECFIQNHEERERWEVIPDIFRIEEVGKVSYRVNRFYKGKYYPALDQSFVWQESMVKVECRK